MQLRVLTATDVESCLSMADAIALMRNAFPALSAGDVQIPLRTMIQNARGTILYKPAYWSQAGLFCQKIVSVFPENADEKLPVTAGMIQVNSSDTGMPLALLEAGYLTSLRTGAATAIAVDVLAPTECSSACLFGAGGQAKHQLEALLAVRKLETLWVVSRSESSAKTFCELHQPIAGGCELRAAPSPDIVSECQIVITATTSPTPIVPHKSLPEKVVISAIGSLGPNNSEIAAETILDSDIVVDQREACLSEAGEFRQLLDDGKLPKNFAPVELGELLAKSAKRSGKPRVVFKSVGNAAQDIFCVEHVLAKANEQEIGQFVQL